MVIKKKVTAIIQARYNSTRFPGKILRKIKKKTLLEIQIDRLKKSKKINFSKGLKKMYQKDIIKPQKNLKHKIF